MEYLYYKEDYQFQKSAKDALTQQQFINHKKRTRLMDERTSYSQGMVQRCKSSADWIDGMEFVDLDFIGPKYTWSRGNITSTRKCASFNRALCNVNWRLQFLEVTIKHLISLNSDHNPLLLNTDGFATVNTQSCPFRCQAEWMLHPHFSNFMNSTQDDQVNMSNALSCLSETLIEQNKHAFGNLYRRNKQLWPRLKEMQRALTNNIFSGLIKLEKKL